MENFNINIEQIEINDFINHCDTLISQNLNSNSLIKFLAPTFELFSSSFQFEYSAFFLMDSRTYKFEYKDSTDVKKQDKIIEIFNHSIDSGYIAEVIDKEKLVIIQNGIDKNSFNSLIILPVFKHQGVLGIFLIESKQNDFNNLIIDRINLLSKIFAARLEIFLINTENKNILSVIEQKVAVRTLNLINSKRELEIVLNAVQTAILVIEPETNIIIHANPEAIRLISGDEKNIINEAPSLFLEQIPIDDKVIFSRNYESTLTNLNKEKIPIFRSTSKIKYEKEYIIIESFVDITHIKDIERKLKLANDHLEQKVQERTEELKEMVNKLKVEVEERKKAEAEIKKLLEKEKEVNEIKSRFISLVSHEFRTPLTIINTSAQIVQNYRDKISVEEQNQYMKRIQKTVQQMSSLLENVLFFSKSGTLGLKYQPKEFNIVRFSEGVINDVKLSSGKNQEIKFQCNLENEKVFIDSRLYRYILINILSNAIKYSDENTNIDISLNSENHQIILCIKDSGIGIPDNEKDKIFDEFYRAENVGNIPGTGLGLSVIYTSLKSMGGKIEVDSKESIGSTFKITIPNNTKDIS